MSAPKGSPRLRKAPGILRLVGPLELQQVFVTVLRWTWGGMVK